MKNILVIGAGAIGRGYIPWVFPPPDYEYFLDDSNEKLLNKLYKRKRYTTWCTKGGKYEPLTVRVNARVPKDIDIVMIAVGARNFLGLADRFMRTETPIICCENDSRLVPRMKEITGNPNIFFTIPDVITSNTAPQKLLDIDPLSIITEDGIMYIEQEAQGFINENSNAVFLNKADMHREWMAKLYIHNTPHCIAAYLGYQKGYRYIHEAMESNEIYPIVEGAMMECVRMVENIYAIDSDYAENYAHKELARFSNPLLYDPISRVAREPMRKLALSERLIGAAMLCMQTEIYPECIIKGIVAAIHYKDPKDPDCRVMKLFNQLEVEDFVEGILHLRPSEHLYPRIVEALKNEQR